MAFLLRSLSSDDALRLETERRHQAEVRAAHQEHLPRPNVPYFVTSGIRQRSSGTHRREVRLVFEIEPSTHPYASVPSLLKLVDGNVTGYESWYLDDAFFARNGARTETPFFLCAGSGIWDELFLEEPAARDLLCWAHEHG